MGIEKKDFLYDDELHPLEQTAFQLWIEYRYIVESYDRYMTRGTPSPHDPDSFRPLPQYRDLSTRFAGEKMRRMRQIAIVLGVNKGHLDIAKRQVDRFRVKYINELYSELTSKHGKLFDMKLESDCRETYYKNEKYTEGIIFSKNNRQKKEHSL